MSSISIDGQHLHRLSEKVDRLLRQRPLPHGELKSLLESETSYTIAMLLNTGVGVNVRLFLFLPLEKRLEVVDFLSIHTLRSLIRRLSSADLAVLLTESNPSMRLKVMRLIESSRIEELSELVNSHIGHQLIRHANYANRAVGRIMQIDVPTVPAGIEVSEAWQYLTRLAQVSESLNNVYLLDKHEHYVAMLPLSHMIGANQKAKVSALAHSETPILSPNMSQKRVAQLFQEFDVVELPVVENGKLIGRVLVEDIVDIIQSRNLEDVQKLAGVGDGEELIDTPAMAAARRRLPWMVLNMVLGFMAVSVIMPFEELIAQVTALAVLMPIITNMGGNLGIQSLTVSIRSVASGNFDWRLPLYEVRKEVIVGVTNGIILGLLIGVIGFIGWGNPYLGGVVAGAMFINAIVASIAGGILPMLLKKLNLDPALMSGSVLTTITDFTGFLTFLGLASLLLPYLK